MRLYLVQHGKATPKEEDPDRPLTESGQEEVEAMADFIHPLELQIGQMWHSGKTRAKQTARLWMRVLRSARD